MSIISSRFGIDSESKLFSYFGNIGSAILGRPGGKFNLRNRYNQISQFPQKVSLIDTSFGELMQIAQNVPHLNVIITKKAEMFSNMLVKHVDKNGQDIENSDVLKLLKKPNPLQTWQEFLYEYSLMDSIYSNNFIFKNKGSLDVLPKFLWVLPAGAMKINLTGKIFRQTSINDIIESYELMFDNDTYRADQIIQISEGIKPDMIRSASRIVSHQMPLSNIVASLKSQNIITTERGANGLIVSDNTGSNENTLPFNNEEQKRVNNVYKSDYDLDSKNGHIIVSSNSLKFVPITFPVKDLMLFEGTEDSFGTLCDGWGVHRQVFSDSFVHTKTLGQNGNIDDGLKYTYQNTLTPQGIKLLNNLASDMGLDERGERLVPEFDLPCMEADNLNEAQADLAETQRNKILYESNMMDAKNWCDREEIELTGGAIKYEAPKPTLPFGGK